MNAPTRIFVYSPKGGVGTSTVATALAVVAAKAGIRTFLAGDDDNAAILGMAHTTDGPMLVDEDLTFYGAGYRRKVPSQGPASYDLGVYDLKAYTPYDNGYRLLVMESCYLALRRASHSARTPDGVWLNAEGGRALGNREVAAVVCAPIVAVCPVKATIARSIDAGLFARRMPEDMTRQAERVLALPYIAGAKSYTPTDTEPF
jgi:hypothetical protein